MGLVTVWIVLGLGIYKLGLGPLDIAILGSGLFLYLLILGLGSSLPVKWTCLGLNICV